MTSLCAPREASAALMLCSASDVCFKGIASTPRVLVSSGVVLVYVVKIFSKLCLVVLAGS